MGEDVEQHLRIRTGIEMPAVLVLDQLGQLFRVGEIAVVRKSRVLQVNIPSSMSKPDVQAALSKMLEGEF